MKEIYVIKRNGQKAPLDISKIQRQVRNCCHGIQYVSESMIEIKAQLELYNNIKTTVIDTLLLKAMVNLIDENENPDIGNVNYQYVAGRQRLSMLRKEVYGQYSVPSLYSIVKNNVDIGMYTKELLKWYTEDEWNEMDSFVDHSKDEKYTYAAIEQLYDKYLVRNRVTKQIYETPQIRYIIAAATIFHNENKANRMKYVKEYYEYSSNGAFTLATPLLAGLGTPTKQFSSCVLISIGDSLDSIFSSGQMIANYAAKRAGIGIEVGKIRPIGTPIRGGEVKHTGLVPFLKKLFYDLRACSQGSIRNSSCTVFYPIMHGQFEDLIVLKNNQGTEETRIRHMDYGVVINNFFWNKFKNKENITLFNPNEVPDLFEAFYTDTELFISLYNKYEKKPGIFKKTLPAEELIKNGILKERIDTGRIYLVFIDNVMNQGPFDPKHHPIYQSNLCCEILLPSKPFESLEDENGRIALCTLSSINWGHFKSPEQLKPVCSLVVRALSNILGYQDFLSVQSKLSNEELEPLGIGVTNLAYWMAKKDLKYGQEDALAEVKKWIEHQSYYCIEESVNLAKERGPCKHSHLTRYGKGIFPWEVRNKNVNELTDFTPSKNLDWEALRKDLLENGIRNATLLAIAPVESSSLCINSTNGIEMPMQLISTKESKGGIIIQVVPEYHKLKNKYQLMWDQTDCIDYIKTSAVLAAYVDQSISTNTFYDPSNYSDGKIPATIMAKNLMLASYWGLKTVYYNITNKQGKKSILEEKDEVCESCVL